MASSATARENGSLKKLRVGEDIPAEVMKNITGDGDGLRLQQELQRAVVEALGDGLRR